MRKFFFWATVLCCCTAAYSQTSSKSFSPVGVWLTTDDETGEAKSHIQIYEHSGMQYGKIIKLLRANLNHKCDQCTGDRKDQPMLGMVIIEDMALHNGCWQDGRVLYPRQGKWYNLKYWLKDGDANTLVVRGSFGPFFRTQYWHRVE